MCHLSVVEFEVCRAEEVLVPQYRGCLQDRFTAEAVNISQPPLLLNCDIVPPKSVWEGILHASTGAKWPNQGEASGRAGGAGAATPGFARTLSRLSVEEEEPAVNVHNLVYQIKSGLTKWQVGAV